MCIRDSADTGAGWQRAGAAPFFRGGQLASGRDCDRGLVLWRAVGVVGRLFRDTSGDVGQRYFVSLAFHRPGRCICMI